MPPRKHTRATDLHIYRSKACNGEIEVAQACFQKSVSFFLRLSSKRLPFYRFVYSSFSIISRLQCNFESMYLNKTINEHNNLLFSSPQLKGI